MTWRRDGSGLLVKSIRGRTIGQKDARREIYDLREARRRGPADWADAEISYRYLRETWRRRRVARHDRSPRRLRAAIEKAWAERRP